MELMIVGLSKADGETALDDLDDARSDKEVKLDDLALVYRNAKGKVKIQQTSDATLGQGVVRGGVLGLVAGVAIALTGPASVGAAALATVIGGAVGAVITAFDDGVDNPMMRKLGATLEENESVLLALGDEAEIQKLKDGFAEHAAGVEYHVVPEASQNFIKELAKLSPEELGKS